MGYPVLHPDARPLVTSDKHEGSAFTLVAVTVTATGMILRSDLGLLAEAALASGVTIVITQGFKTTLTRGGKTRPHHPKEGTYDVRTRHLTRPERSKLANSLKQSFDVLIEETTAEKTEHLHITRKKR